VRAVCDRHGIVLIGSCVSEGIYGEIAIFEANELQGMPVESQFLTNLVEGQRETYPMEKFVLGIGTPPP
jgi:hypothetical protein